MKRVQVTDQIAQIGKAALGADFDLVNTPIYEAIAFNTLPIRKKHFLFRGARADRSLLAEMALALAVESRPMHIGHESSGAPLGRVFYGQVHDTVGQSELRTLFFIDPSETATIAKLENGTFDQVSVSVLPKQLLNSVSGFDYLGADADIDNLMSGTDPDGNTLNENGVYARMLGLDAFFEMSLVGQGGAQNARIVRREQSVFGSSYQKLAASGVDPNALILVATVETPKMDLTEILAKLSSTTIDLANMTSTKSTLDAQIATLTAANATLTASLAEAGDAVTSLAAKDAEIVTLTSGKTEAEAARDAAVAALSDTATKVLVAAGKPVDALPTDVPALVTLINETSTNLVAALAKGGNASGADSLQTSPVYADLSAFTN